MLTQNIIATNEAAAAAAQAKDWPACSSALIAKTIEVRDATLRTSNWASKTLTDIIDPETGATEADILLGTLQAATAPRVKAAYASFCAGGLDVSDDQVQGMLPQLATAANWPDGLGDKILQWGIRFESTASQNGLSDADCSPELCQRAISIGDANDWLNAQIAVIRERLQSAQITDRQGVVDYLSSVFSIGGE